DVVPTVLDLLGLPPHAEARGRSLVPQMDGAPPDPNRIAYSEPFDLDIPTRTVITDRRQLIVDTRSAVPSLLFDLDADPMEKADIAAREPAEVTRLATALDAYRQEAAPRAAGAPPPPPAELDAETRRQLQALGYVQ